jgi:hypothetical protein
MLVGRKYSSTEILFIDLLFRQVFLAVGFCTPMYSKALQPWDLNANLLCFFAVKFIFISTGSATILLRKLVLRRLPLLKYLANVRRSCSAMLLYSSCSSQEALIFPYIIFFFFFFFFPGFLYRASPKVNEEKPKVRRKSPLPCLFCSPNPSSHIRTVTGRRRLPPVPRSRSI